MATVNDTDDGRDAPDGKQQEPPPGDTDGADAAPDSRLVLVGGGYVGRALAERLAAERPVRHIDAAGEPTASTPSIELGEVEVLDGSVSYETVTVADLTSLPALRSQELLPEDLVVVLTGDDAQSLLVTQLLRTKLGAGRICVVVADPRNADAFEIPDVTVVCTAATLADAVGTATALPDVVEQTTSEHGTDGDS